jgi:hypothetical protein
MYAFHTVFVSVEQGAAPGSAIGFLVHAKPNSIAHRPDRAGRAITPSLHSTLLRTYGKSDISVILHSHVSTLFPEHTTNCKVRNDAYLIVRAESQTSTPYQQHKMASHQKSPVDLAERVKRWGLLLVTGV